MITPIARCLGPVRRALAAHARHHEDGITMAIFAIALIVLLGMVALGIDGSRIYDERRRAQNAADHAAIAAAYESCTTTAVDVVAAAEAAGLNSAEQNGFNDDGVSNEVDINVTGGSGSHQYEAIVDTTIPTTFGVIIGFDELDTHARAEAEATGCEPTGSTVPAMFGGGNCPGNEKDIDISGENHVVTGLTHTNGSFYNGGSDNTFTNGGPAVTYVEDFEGKKPDNNVYVEDEDDVDEQPWPTGFDPTVNMTTTMWNAYKSSSLRAPSNQGNDTQDKFDIVDDGIYYTEYTSEVKVESIADGASFVIVSKNAPVRFEKEHNDEYFAFENNPSGTPDNVIVVSGFGAGYSETASERCSQMAFLRSGNYGIWNGIFWAPHATIEWSGNNGEVVGGLVGWGVKLNGNFHTITGGTGTGAQEPFVFLLQ